MKLHLLLACSLGLTVGVMATPAIAQSDAPIRLVVPTTAGGPLDVVARVLAGAIARNTKETVFVENRPGAGGVIGTDYVAKAPPDGRTVLLMSGFVVTNTVLYKVAYDPMRDLVPVIKLGKASMVMLARKGLEARAPQDLQRAAAARRGGLNCGAPPGEMALACEQLKQALGGAVVTVPYPGVAPAVNALAAGQIDVMLAPYDAAVPWADGERILPIATTGAAPLMAPFDRLPQLRETWPGFVVDGMIGIMAPAGTPPDVVRRLNRDFALASKDPKMRELMLARGSSVEEDTSPEKLASALADRLAYYRRLAQSLGLKPE
ncbi:Bug family tripartite tricarboxylate transporter substrate binding protein [Caenimonas koreensis]|nr:tripartite tricarboxylate transporter substrate binding protein [Caenimonas koreensis]